MFFLILSPWGGGGGGSGGSKLPKFFVKAITCYVIKDKTFTHTINYYRSVKNRDVTQALDIYKCSMPWESGFLCVV